MTVPEIVGPDPHSLTIVLLRHLAFHISISNTCLGSAGQAGIETSGCWSSTIPVLYPPSLSYVLLTYSAISLVVVRWSCCVSLQKGQNIMCRLTSGWNFFKDAGGTQSPCQLSRNAECCSPIPTSAFRFWKATLNYAQMHILTLCTSLLVSEVYR